MPAFTDEVRRILADVELRAPYSALVGWVILLFGAIGIFSQMEFAFDRLWHDTAPHSHGVRAAIVNALKNRLKAFLALIALGILTIFVFAADLGLAAVKSWTEARPAGTEIWDLVQLAFSLGLNSLVLTLLYRLMPRRKVRWLHAAAGGVAAAVVWQFGGQILGRFILSGNYSAYGVVGSFIAFMLWVYGASIILYVGAQLVQVLGNPYEPPPPAAGKQ